MAGQPKKKAKSAPAASEPPKKSGGKVSKTNATRNSKGEKIVVTSSRKCDHCGERMIVGEILGVKRITTNPSTGRSNTRMFVFAKDHPQTLKAA